MDLDAVGIVEGAANRGEPGRPKIGVERPIARATSKEE